MNCKSKVTEKLFEMSDPWYKEFQCSLMPTVNADSVIGVRVPLLKKYAKELYGSDECARFLSNLPHKYYEENTLHGFVIGQIRDFDACIKEAERFLPYINNWATCDSLRPICFKKNCRELLPYIEKWLSSKHIYTVRFGIEMLMVYFLESEYEERYTEMVLSVVSDEYYVNMMIAWYFATALAKQWESVIGYIENGRLSSWVHNKTIQKAVESFRITDEQKAYLKTLRRHGSQKP